MQVFDRHVHASVVVYLGEEFNGLFVIDYGLGEVMVGGLE